MRTFTAILATLGLLAALTAVPVFAQSCDATDGGSLTELVTDDVTLTFDSDFACTDAAATGTWSIVVNVANDSDVDVTIEDVSLSHTTPPMGDDEDANTAEAEGLPVTIVAGSFGDFTVDGDYALVETGEGGLVNLHLRATGSTDGDESAPFTLGINVHVLGPGVELEDGDPNGGAEGRPDWVPGPPPWVMLMLQLIFPDAFPWGGDTFPPAGDEEGADASEGAGRPSWVQLPPQAGGDDSEDVDADDGPPEWVPGPPAGAGKGGGRP